MSTTTTTPVTKRAVGVIRVSRLKGRDKKNGGEGFHSPEVQRDRIRDLCGRHDGWRLVDVLDENEGESGKLRDASGAKPLAERPKLLEAVEAIEALRYDVLAVAYADRLTWTQSVREEVLGRIEAVGGEVWAEDNGRLTNGSAVEEFSGTTLTAASRFIRRQAAEKARAAQVEAVDAGVWMSTAVPPGYLRGPERRLVIDPETAPIVVKAFELRAKGAALDQVRQFLKSHGIERTRAAVGRMLRSRTYLGELHFGGLEPNLTAHDKLLDAKGDVWRAVQKASSPTGPKPSSERLLARLGVLRCGNCGARMSVTTSNYKYPAYRCGQHESCDARQTISATIVEEVVGKFTRAAFDGIQGSADGLDRDDAAQALDQATRKHKAALDVLDPTDPDEAAKLREFRAARDTAQERLDEISVDMSALAVVLRTERDWPSLSINERRDVIRALIERVEVHPGRGAGRLRIVPKGV